MLAEAATLGKKYKMEEPEYGSMGVNFLYIVRLEVASWRVLSRGRPRA